MRVEKRDLYKENHLWTDYLIMTPEVYITFLLYLKDPTLTGLKTKC